MHIITRARLAAFWEKHPASRTSLLLWYKLTLTARWQSLVDVCRVLPTADSVGNLTVFNIGGNKYRLITLIDYTYQKVFIRSVLTHAEYDKNN
ncbi:hypothetical protein C8255_22990 [filamentous cyanobacterium CCP3]|nr:hypothetical protein C8255_22990 [filamentous cyanobacterium CCP3]